MNHELLTPRERVLGQRAAVPAAKTASALPIAIAANTPWALSAKETASEMTSVPMPRTDQPNTAMIFESCVVVR